MPVNRKQLFSCIALETRNPENIKRKEKWGGAENGENTSDISQYTGVSRYTASLSCRMQLPGEPTGAMRLFPEVEVWPERTHWSQAGPIGTPKGIVPKDS